jgi:hypothetical protein
MKPILDIIAALNPFQNLFTKRTIEEKIKWLQFKLEYKFDKKKARRAFKAWKKDRDNNEK